MQVQVLVVCAGEALLVLNDEGNPVVTRPQWSQSPN